MIYIKETILYIWPLNPVRGTITICPLNPVRGTITMWRFISICMRTVFCSLLISPHWREVINKTHPSFS